MEFLENIKSSIYNPVFYKELLAKPFSFSLKYFLSLMGLIALIMTIVFALSALPEINAAINQLMPKILNYYPDGMEITVKSGKVSTNVSEPYFIKMPVELKSSEQDSKDKPVENVSDVEEADNLLVIDTISPLTVDLFKNYKTAVLLSGDSVIYYDNEAIKIQSLDKSWNGVVTKAKFSQGLDKIMPYIKLLPLGLPPIVFVVIFFGLIFGNLLYLIFGAFAIWLAAKIRKRSLSYGKAYQIGLHAIALGVILEVAIFSSYPALEFPLFPTLLMLAIYWINLKPLSGINNIPPVSSGDFAAGEKI